LKISTRITLLIIALVGAITELIASFCLINYFIPDNLIIEKVKEFAGITPDSNMILHVRIGLAVAWSMLFILSMPPIADAVYAGAQNRHEVFLIASIPMVVSGILVSFLLSIYWRKKMLGESPRRRLSEFLFVIFFLYTFPYIIGTCVYYLSLVLLGIKQQIFQYFSLQSVITIYLLGFLLKIPLIFIINGAFITIFFNIIFAPRKIKKS